jgi:hypothetical protein
LGGSGGPTGGEYVISKSGFSFGMTFKAINPSTPKIAAMTNTENNTEAMVEFLFSLWSLSSASALNLTCMLMMFLGSLTGGCEYPPTQRTHQHRIFLEMKR